MRLLRHVLLPLLGALAIVGLYLTPVTLIGCANRGLAAFGVALACLLTGFWTIAVGARLRLRGDRAFWWWLVSTAVLCLPALLLLGPLG